MYKDVVRRRNQHLDSDASDGYFLLVALISTFLISTLAIVIGMGFALMS